MCLPILDDLISSQSDVWSNDGYSPASGTLTTVAGRACDYGSADDCSRACVSPAKGVCPLGHRGRRSHPSCERKREGERQTDRQTGRGTERERETDRGTERERQAERERQTDRQRERDRDR